MMNPQTEIRVELTFAAPRAKVWNALTTAEGWTGWFSEGVEGLFTPGEMLTLDFGKYGKCFAIVTERVENESFAYKWHPGEDCPIDKYPEAEMTEVRFTIEDAGSGTRLVMVESGFEKIPESRLANALEMNTSGWNSELEELQAFIDTDARQVTQVAQR